MTALEMIEAAQQALREGNVDLAADWLDSAHLELVEGDAS